MELSLTPLDGGGVQFPLLPEKVSVRTGAKTLSFSLVNGDDLKLPRGCVAGSFLFDFMLPGEHLSGASWVQNWQPPQSILQALEAFRDEGARLRLMLTETPINQDVFIETLNSVYQGAHGDIRCSITLVRYPDLTISTLPAQGGGGTEGAGSGRYGLITLNKKSGKLKIRAKPNASAKVLDKLPNGSTLEILGESGNWYQVRTPEGVEGYANKKYVLETGASGHLDLGSGYTVPSHSPVYTVKAGDTLYTIAKAQLGSGSRYTEIYKLNKKAIDKANRNQKVNRYNVEPGMALQLP